MSVYYVIDLDTREIVLPRRRLTERTAGQLARGHVRDTGHHTAVAELRSVYRPG